MTFKKCRNEGCEVLIEVRNTDVGWRPYEESGNKHNCQFSEYAKAHRAVQGQTETSRQNEEKIKNNHGNELVQNIDPNAISNQSGTVLGYVDHTQVLAKPSEVKIFFGDLPADVEKEYRDFQIGKKFAWTRAQYQPVRDEDGKVLFTICFFYEEAKQ